MIDQEIAVASIDYDVDNASKVRFRAALAPLVNAKTAIVDLSGARYIDSTGVTELLLLYRARKEHGGAAIRLVTGDSSGTVARIVELAGLQSAFDLFESLEAARA